MGSKVKLGKKWYKVKRYSSTGGGSWVNGEYVEGVTTEVSIFANIQPAFSMNQTKLLPEGDREKKAIWGSSNHWVYEADSGTPTIPADIILYNGYEWEVKGVMPYGNIGEHCEFVATKIDKSKNERVTGLVGSIE